METIVYRKLSILLFALVPKHLFRSLTTYQGNVSDVSVVLAGAAGTQPRQGRKQTVRTESNSNFFISLQSSSLEIYLWECPYVTLSIKKKWLYKQTSKQTPCNIQDYQ